MCVTRKAWEARPVRTAMSIMNDVLTHNEKFRAHDPYHFRRTWGAVASDTRQNIERYTRHQ